MSPVREGALEGPPDPEESGEEGCPGWVSSKGHPLPQVAGPIQGAHHLPRIPSHLLDQEDPVERGDGASAVGGPSAPWSHMG